MVIPPRYNDILMAGGEGTGGRKHSRQQGLMLEEWVRDRGYNLYPTKEEKQQLAHSTSMTYHQVSRWFANRRRKIKVAAGLDVISTSSTTTTTNSPFFGGGGSSAPPHPSVVDYHPSDAVVPGSGAPIPSPGLSHSPASTEPAASPHLADSQKHYLNQSEFGIKDSSFDFLKIKALQTLRDLAANPDSDISKLIMTQSELGLISKIPHLDPNVLEETKKLCSSPNFLSGIISPFQTIMSQTNHQINDSKQSPLQQYFENENGGIHQSMDDCANLSPTFSDFNSPSMADFNSNFLSSAKDKLHSTNQFKVGYEGCPTLPIIESDFSEKQIRLQKKFNEQEQQRFLQARQAFLLSQLYSDLLRPTNLANHNGDRNQLSQQFSATNHLQQNMAGMMVPSDQSSDGTQCHNGGGGSRYGTRNLPAYDNQQFGPAEVCTRSNLGGTNSFHPSREHFSLPTTSISEHCSGNNICEISQLMSNNSNNSSVNAAITESWSGFAQNTDSQLDASTMVCGIPQVTLTPAASVASFAKQDFDSFEPLIDENVMRNLAIWQNEGKLPACDMNEKELIAVEVLVEFQMRKSEFNSNSSSGDGDLSRVDSIVNDDNVVGKFGELTTTMNHFARKDGEMTDGYWSKSAPIKQYG